MADTRHGHDERAAPEDAAALSQGIGDAVSDAPDTEGAETLSFLRALAHAPERTPPTPGAALATTRAPGGGPLPERFELGQCLGEGGFGVVYEAFDRERRAQVALKVMRRRDANALYLFKREFRALAELHHPHLVRLYELHSDGDTWFFTMERIHGARLDAALPPPGSAALRARFRQVAEGLCFLHAGGRLHRDIKPSNVLVTTSGQVKILDFGLVTGPDDDPGAHFVAGTPEYMAPEQAAGGPVGPAADWYAFGVMLHQALTGARPRRAGSPTRPDEAGPPPGAEVPEDLWRLCLDLLADAPALRPTGGEVLTRLAERAGHGLPLSEGGSRQREAPFVGRALERAALHAARTAAEAGRCVVLLLHGPSGAGKSALMRRFFDELRDAGTPGLHLSGRCFAQESVPYKALDSLVDALCAHLARRSPEELAALWPDDMDTLACLFPVLRRLPLPRERGPAGSRPGGPELRQRAFSALRELLARLGKHGAPTLFIDDLHWGDLDSIALLLELLRPPAPPLLLVAGFRGEERGTSPVLGALESALGGALCAGLDVRELPLGALDDAASEQLARELLGGGDLAGARAIAAEAHGSPFLIAELSRNQEEQRTGAEPVPGPQARPQGLGAILGARLERLPEQARRLLEVVAVAGQPLARALAARTAFPDPASVDEPGVLSLLRSAHLLRVQRSRGGEEVLPYHDKVAEAAVSRLPSSLRRDYHHQLATALQQAPEAEPERIGYHLEGAERPAEAAPYLDLAAARAFEALAFERAAELSRRALAHGRFDTAGELRLLERRAQALGHAGRPREAAEAYLTLSAKTAGPAGLTHRRRAAEHLLVGGYTDRGLEQMTRVLGELGLRLPSSTPLALLSLVGLRLGIFLQRKFGGTLPPATGAPEPTEYERERIDACWSASVGLALVNPIRAAHFQTWHLLLALRAREPYLLLRALGIEGFLSSFYFPVIGALRRARMFEQARVLAERIGTPRAVASHSLIRGLSAVMEGRLEQAELLLQSSISLLREHGLGLGVPWQLDYARVHQLHALWMRGQLGGFIERSSRLLKEVRERGNRLCETQLMLDAQCLVLLVQDEPARALAGIEEALGSAPPEAFHVHRIHALWARVKIALYSGQSLWPTLRGEWSVRHRLGVVRVPLARIETRYWRALTALAAVDAGQPGLLRIAEASARALERERLSWTTALANILRAAVAERRGKATQAVAALETAEATLRGLDMSLWAAAARRRLGEARQGRQGLALIEEADAWMAGQGIQDPARFTRMLVWQRPQAPAPSE